MIVKPIPKSWADMPKPLDWAAGATPASMSALDAANDLAHMDVRPAFFYLYSDIANSQPRRNHPPIPITLSRHASPQRYANPAATPQTHTSTSSSFAPYSFHPEEGFQHPQNHNHGHGQYAQRAPVQVPPGSHHQLHRLGQGPSGSGSGSGTGTGTGTGTGSTSSQGQSQTGYGPAVFNEPRREGRTVPTSSALFDSGRRNEGGVVHQSVQAQAQAPPPAPGLGAELWGKDRMNGQGQGHSLVPGPNGRGVGMTVVSNAIMANGDANNNGNGNGNGNGEANGNGNSNGNGNGNGNSIHKDPSPPAPEVIEQKPRPDHPGRNSSPTSMALTPHPTPTQTSAQQEKLGSPPKSSLGITGIPSGLPFI
jgi:hypothetical protein